MFFGLCELLVGSRGVGKAQLHGMHMPGRIMGPIYKVDGLHIRGTCTAQYPPCIVSVEEGTVQKGTMDRYVVALVDAKLTRPVFGLASYHTKAKGCGCAFCLRIFPLCNESDAKAITLQHYTGT